jgi:hypothetical protein
MKTITELTTVQETITLLAEIKNKGFADVITQFDSFSCVNDFSIRLFVPKWVSGADHTVKITIYLDKPSENSKAIERLRQYAENGFANDPAIAEAKKIELERKLAWIEKLQKEIAEENN